MPNLEPRYSFRGVTAADMGMLEQWLGEPHVARWWGDPQTAIVEITQAMSETSTRPMIVSLDGEPIAYLQSYDPHMEADHPYRDQPAGTLGLDISIGDPALVGVGHGSAILRQFVEEQFACGVCRFVIDPDPENRAAIRAYEKAGFTAFGTRVSIYGPAFMMARDAPTERVEA